MGALALCVSLYHTSKIGIVRADKNQQRSCAAVSRRPGSFSKRACPRGPGLFFYEEFFISLLPSGFGVCSVQEDSGNQAVLGLGAWRSVVGKTWAELAKPKPEDDAMDLLHIQLHSGPGMAAGVYSSVVRAMLVSCVLLRQKRKKIRHPPSKRSCAATSNKHASARELKSAGRVILRAKIRQQREGPFTGGASRVKGSPARGAERALRPP